MKPEPILVHLSDPADAARLDGKTFQIHAVSMGVVRLYPITIEPPDTRCPVVVHGERCGLTQGHDGKHYWQGGD